MAKAKRGGEAIVDEDDSSPPNERPDVEPPPLCFGDWGGVIDSEGNFRNFHHGINGIEEV
jgi:hypothetical protein